MPVGKKKDRITRVPVIFQMDEPESGAAALAMILAYYNKWIPFEQVRRDCAVLREGSTIPNILRAAEHYRLNAESAQAEMAELKSREKYPCIIRLKPDHFAVLNGFRDGQAVLNDPAQGTIMVREKDFAEDYTGDCMFVSPGEGFEESGKPKSVFAFARNRLEGSGSAVLFTVLCSVAASLIAVIDPAFSGIFVDRLLTGRNPSWTGPAFTFLILFTLLEWITSFAQTKMLIQMNGKMDAVGNAGYFWKVLHLPMEYFSQRNAGELVERQNTNAHIAEMLISTYMPLALQAVMLIFYVFVMISYSVRLTIIGIAAVLLNLLATQIVSGKRVVMAQRRMRSRSRLDSLTLSDLERIETIKACGAETGIMKYWLGHQAAVNAEKVRYDRADRVYELIIRSLSYLMNMGITMIGIWFIMSGKFTIGALASFEGYLGLLLPQAMQFISAGQKVQEMRVQMERIEDVMNYPSDEREESEEFFEDGYRKLSGSLEMNHVTFGYSEAAEPLIRDFSLSLKPGGSVALVGGSGSGKTTLSRLISGLYHPWSGEILFDGTAVDRINHSILTGSLAVVDQEITIFEDTIAANIRMWDDSIEDFEVIMAARDAQIHENIMKKEDGYQHILTDGGSEFSGGERQRLEIARVLAMDPTIVILDEATSALDAKTEAEVVNAIRERGITCIIIAHRLSTIRNCDEIIVLEDGKIVERGTHETLYANNGVYTELVANE